MTTRRPPMTMPPGHRPPDERDRPSCDDTPPRHGPPTPTWPPTDDLRTILGVILDQLTNVRVDTAHIRTNQEKTMAEFDDMSALLDDVRVATDANAAKLDIQSTRLGEIITILRQGGTMTAEQKAALAEKATGIKTSLDDEIGRLEATGVDPNNPTPA